MSNLPFPTFLIRKGKFEFRIAFFANDCRPSLEIPLLRFSQFGRLIVDNPENILRRKRRLTQ